MKIAGIFLVAVLAILPFSMGVAYSFDASSVVAAWVFDKDEDASDITGNGHDGEIDGNVDWVAGKFGSAVRLDGSSAVIIDHEDDLSLETFTLVSWVKLENAPTDWWTIIAKDGWPDRNYGIFLANETGLVHSSFASGAAPDNNAVNAVTPVLADDWYHVAATYDMSVSRLYINGVLDIEAPFSATPNITDVPVIIGRTPTDTYKYEGMIDEVAIFNKALSEDDINEIMNSGLRITVATVDSKDKLAATWGDIKR